MKKKTNETYDKYHKTMIISQVTVLIVLIFLMLVITISSALRIYMLNGYEKKWEFSLVTHSEKQGVHYKYIVDGKEYVCYQFATSDGAKKMPELKVFHNTEYPIFSYVEPFRNDKITDIKIYTLCIDLIILCLLICICISELGLHPHTIRTKREKRIAREIEHARTN